MSQASPTIGANKSGLDYRTEDNDGKRALLNHHKGSTAPGYAEAGTLWLDDAATPWILKCHDGTDWIAMGTVNAATNKFGHGTGIFIDGSADEIQLTVQAHSTQTSNVFVVEQSGGGDLFSVANNGDTVLNGGITVDGLNDRVQLRVQANSTQTSNILEVENSAGTDLFIIESDGDVIMNKPSNAASTFDIKNQRNTTANVGALRFYGHDSAANETLYGGLDVTITDATNGSEDAQFGIFAQNNNDGGGYVARFANGVQIGSPTGGFKGVGTLNATAVYDDNTLLTCYVLQTYLDGTPNDEIWSAVLPEGREHFGYNKFKQRLGTAYDPLDLDGYWQHAMDKGHLTSLPSRVNWDKEQAISTGELLQRLWETVEIQAVHIHKLNTRLKVLESA